MSLFSDTLADVYKVTNRPDLSAETALVVRQVTLAAHRSEYFYKDLTEQQVTLNNSGSSTLQFSISAFFTRLRAFKYIRPSDGATGIAASGVLLEPIDANGIFDDYLAEKLNTYYVAGDNLNLRLEAAWYQFLIGYYQNPVLSPDDSYDSWIVREQPAVVVSAAISRVFAMIGMQEDSNRWQQLAMLELQLLKATNIEVEGR